MQSGKSSGPPRISSGLRGWIAAETLFELFAAVGHSLFGAMDQALEGYESEPGCNPGNRQGLPDFIRATGAF